MSKVSCFQVLIAISILILAKATPGTRPLIKSVGKGERNGIAFDDLADFNSSCATIIGIHSFRISYGEQVNALQVSYLLSDGVIYRVPRHGKFGDRNVTIKLDPDEYVIKVEGKTDKVLTNQLTITTAGPSYVKKVYGPFGSGGRFNFSFEGYIVGFHGRSGDLLDNVGVYYFEDLKQSPTYGSGGEACVDFGDRLDKLFPPIIGISKIHIWERYSVNTVKVEYIQLGGGNITVGEDSVGEYTCITLAKGEQIVEMFGIARMEYILLFNLKIRRPDGRTIKYGPFGDTSTYFGGAPFSFTGNIYGFFGSNLKTDYNKEAEPMLTALGVYYT